MEVSPHGIEPQTVGLQPTAFPTKLRRQSREPVPSNSLPVLGPPSEGGTPVSGTLTGYTGSPMTPDGRLPFHVYGLTGLLIPAV
jgi:hypothetical protein